GVVAAGRRRLEVGRAVVDPEVGLTKRVRQLLGADQRLWLAHGVLPSLIRRRAHDKAVEVLGHLDLAREPRVGLYIEGEVELVLLLIGALAHLLYPGLVDIDHAGGAGARAAALGDDAGHAALERRLHHGGADLRLDRVHGAVVLDIGDLGHWARWLYPALSLVPMHYNA